MVVAANLASVPTENWLTYTYNDAAGYERLNPSQLPARFVGFYDNNNRGDVSASGGVYFADENALFTTGYAPLLEAGSTNWTVALGFINDQREVFTTASDPGADVNAIVVLTPINANPADFTGDGVVDAADLAALIAAWGSSGPADLDADGVVDAADLAALIAAWG
jgi:hypothetical protein